jgi:calcineurin-like phosphoesterase family protein
MDWFSSDLHLGHENLIIRAGRPFSNVEEMDRVIIENWNNLIKPTDRVFIIGDLAWGSRRRVIDYLKVLSGRKHLLKGNHDHHKVFKGETLKYLEWMKEYYELKINDAEMDVVQEIMLFHYPIGSWNKMHHGSWQLHGHSHGSYPQSDHLAQYDVSVDVNDWKPVSYEQIKNIMTKKVFKPVDHHGRPW